MSVFRNNPRTNDANNRFAEAPARPDAVDLLNQDAPQPGDNGRTATPTVATATPSSSFPSFSERETRPMPTEADKCANVIAAGSKWSGSLNIEDSVRIEGQLSGEVVAKGTVHIAEGARVDAKVRAAFVVVNGAFKGEVRCSERLELMPKSRLEGQIVTKVLNVHEGAVLDGSIQMTADREPAAGTNNRNSRDADRNGSEEVATEPPPGRARAAASPSQN
jgi:cytoskeletal protein CcmA (bactofilin family)